MEVCINMRVFKTLLLVIALLAMGVEANPLPHHNTRDQDVKPDYQQCPDKDSKKEPLVDHYDQRQNGTENYRVKGSYERLSAPVPKTEWLRFPLVRYPVALANPSLSLSSSVGSRVAYSMKIKRDLKSFSFLSSPRSSTSCMYIFNRNSK
jgi:hypothetical protein